MPSSETVSDTKRDRIYLRTTYAQKQALARAARIRCVPTTEFVLQASLQAAEQVIADEDKIRLSERDFARFVELIENPAPPTDALQSKMASYDTLKRSYPEANL